MLDIVLKVHVTKRVEDDMINMQLGTQQKIKGRFREGYYKLHSPENDYRSILVHYYFCDDSNCWGFGFNKHDGGGFLPEWDLEAGVILTYVEVVPKYYD